MAIHIDEFSSVGEWVTARLGHAVVPSKRLERMGGRAVINPSRCHNSRMK